jgi:hypothetical protein
MVPKVHKINKQINKINIKIINSIIKTFFNIIKCNNIMKIKNNNKTLNKNLINQQALNLISANILISSLINLRKKKNHITMTIKEIIYKNISKN